MKNLYLHAIALLLLTAMLAVAKVGTDFPKFHIAVCRHDDGHLILYTRDHIWCILIRYIPFCKADTLFGVNVWAVLGFYEKPKCHAAVICKTSDLLSCGESYLLQLNFEISNGFGIKQKLLF